MKNKDRKYLNQVRARYGLSPSLHKDLHEAQGGRCAICQTDEAKLTTRLCVDHDHSTGKVRGLLCRMCNQGLGAHERAGTGTYKWYLEWTPMMRLEKMKTLTDEERSLWNW